MCDDIQQLWNAPDYPPRIKIQAILTVTIRLYETSDQTKRCAIIAWALSADSERENSIAITVSAALDMNSARLFNVKMQAGKKFWHSDVSAG